MTAYELLVAGAWKATWILAAAFLGNVVLRRASAATRHFVWTVSLGTVLVLPVALLVAPQWGVPAEVLGTPGTLLVVTGHGGPAAAPTVPAAPPIPWLPLTWGLGLAVTASWCVTGAWKVRRIVRSGQEAGFAGAWPVKVVVSRNAPVPMACGIWKPAVVLPPAACDWPAPRLHAVILHEIAHVRRGDLLAQVVGQFACCVYWFHPLTWLAARQLRLEREQACDDAVVSGGISAPDYATHLVELARTLGRTRFLAPAMAEAAGLEGRIRALLDRKRNRRPLGTGAVLATLAASLLLLLPAAAIHAKPTPAAIVTAPPLPLPAPVEQVRPAPVRVAAPRPAPVLVAQAQPTSVRPASQDFVVLSGVVEDASSARVANCTVYVHNVDGPGYNELTTQTNPVGAYTFAPLPAGRYTIEFRMPGFSVARRDVILATGQPAVVNAALTLGSTQEAVVVQGKRSVPAALPPSATQRVRVGGNVQPARLIVQTKPVYPEELQQEGIVGSVIINAGISTTGEPASLQVASPGLDSRLVRAALDAVRQWRYTPALLNGEAVPFNTQITVDFRLDP